MKQDNKIHFKMKTMKSIYIPQNSWVVLKVVAAPKKIQKHKQLYKNQSSLKRNHNMLSKIQTTIKIKSKESNNLNKINKN